MFNRYEMLDVVVAMGMPRESLRAFVTGSLLKRNYGGLTQSAGYRRIRERFLSFDKRQGIQVQAISCNIVARLFRIRVTADHPHHPHTGEYQSKPPLTLMSESLS